MGTVEAAWLSQTRHPTCHRRSFGRVRWPAPRRRPGRRTAAPAKLAPGFVLTPLCERLSSNLAKVAELAGRTMIGRNGLADDFADAAVFLASSACAYITGQSLFMDGGCPSTDRSRHPHPRRYDRGDNAGNTGPYD